MRVATVRLNGITRAGRVEGDELVLLDYPDAAAALTADDAHRDGPRIPLATAVLGAPSLNPSKVFCVGLNYATHITEMGRDLPSSPTLFAKFARALIGPTDPITLPAGSEKVDWEAELVVVIGKAVRHADQQQAQAAIAGYTVMNDISARDFQRRSAQWLAGKTFEGSTPVGPVIATPDEVDNAADLEIRCEVDGEVMQRARTGDLVFDPVSLVVDISQIITLEPGDLIATGTPGGVGAARDPERYLSPGQEVRTSIEGIGELRNRCEEGAHR